MALINLSTRDLEAFLALAHAHHFTRAAEKCHLSQSAFSQKIARIEQTAGVALFERSTRHVTLTPEGEVFAQEVTRIQQDLQHAVSHLNELATRRIGKVAIAALPSVAAVWMPRVISRYRAANPNIRIELFDTLAEGGFALLREGRVDVFIAAGADVREFDVTELRNEPFHLVCRPSHRFAGKRSVSLAQLKGEEVIHLARSSSVRQHLEAAGATAQPNALEVEHLATVAALVAQGLGVSIVPELALFHFERAGLVCVPVRDRHLRRPIILARRKGKALSVAAKAMVEEILSEARQAKR
ncbi:LysR family transcriptional regulator [Ramlibacter sp. WS9]|uniref:LysR family transcriptional regulator n=1 Tax=Ramlibacter sp. WS9 TaxID=1882741 RepID=UPI001144A5F8|nr:LysR family transcriptional regulator [Ramlibacter sp. WS9]ROZ78834.1 LysR family transcriptional regulator [Ramlibacter sp. WS9]